MEEKLFNIIEKYIYNYLDLINVEFIEKPVRKVDFNDSYTNNNLIFKNAKSNFGLELSLVVYETKSIISITYSRFNENGDILSWLNFIDYFTRYRGIPDSKLKFFLSNNLETLDAELKQFFDWLTIVTDAQLINILQGKDWVDIPFDWGGYK